MSEVVWSDISDNYIYLALFQSSIGKTVSYENQICELIGNQQNLTQKISKVSCFIGDKKSLQIIRNI